ncbi:MAG: alpha/beta hydrolase [Chloroflexia bacterium]
MPTPTQTLKWSPDILPGFEAATLTFPDDYDGPVKATLVRRKATAPTKLAFLYIHGFVDYFYQTHLADECNANGYNFYALDLRKYGRSLNNARHPNFCKDIREYYPEITAAINIITETDGNTFLALNGHSTGGLITSLYTAEGQARGKINALFLNSPFFDFNVSPGLKRVTSVMGKVGKIAPFIAIKALSPLYVESIHKNYHGEWDFDLKLKPREGFPTYAGWINAILAAQARVRSGLPITVPVLLMHSDKSVYGKEWSEEFHKGDAVLNVEHMKQAVPNLGPNVTTLEIKGGLHDLTLSNATARAFVFQGLFTWLKGVTLVDMPQPL